MGGGAWITVEAWENCKLGHCLTLNCEFAAFATETE